MRYVVISQLQLNTMALTVGGVAKVKKREREKVNDRRAAFNKVPLRFLYEEGDKRERDLKE